MIVKNKKTGARYFMSQDNWEKRKYEFSRKYDIVEGGDLPLAVEVPETVQQFLDAGEKNATVKRKPRKKTTKKINNDREGNIDESTVEDFK